MPITMQADFKCDFCGAESSGLVTRYVVKENGEHVTKQKFSGDWVASEQGVFCNEDCSWNKHHNRPVKLHKG